MHSLPWKAQPKNLIDKGSLFLLSPIKPSLSFSNPPFPTYPLWLCNLPKFPLFPFSPYISLPIQKSPYFPVCSIPYHTHPLKTNSQKPYPHIYRDAFQISPCIRPEKICWNFVGPPLYFTPMHTLPETQKKAGNP